MTGESTGCRNVIISTDLGRALWRTDWRGEKSVRDDSIRNRTNKRKEKKQKVADQAEERTERREREEDENSD